MLKSVLADAVLRGRSRRASVPARIESRSPASLPTTRTSVPMRAPSGKSARQDAQLRRVVAVDAEVVHRVAVHGAASSSRFWKIAVATGPRRDDVAIGEESVPARRPRRSLSPGSTGSLRVEGARLVDLRSSPPRARGVARVCSQAAVCAAPRAAARPRARARRVAFRASEAPAESRAEPVGELLPRDPWCCVPACAILIEPISEATPWSPSRAPVQP